jgi:hypothetical protein
VRVVVAVIDRVLWGRQDGPWHKLPSTSTDRLMPIRGGRRELDRDTDVGGLVIVLVGRATLLSTPPREVDVVGCGVPVVG